MFLESATSIYNPNDSVIKHTHPNTLHVESNAIGRNPFVVGGLEQIIWAPFVHKASTKRLNSGIKLVRNQEFVRESCELEVEIIGKLLVFKLSRL